MTYKKSWEPSQLGLKDPSRLAAEKFSQCCGSPTSFIYHKTPRLMSEIVDHREEILCGSLQKMLHWLDFLIDFTHIMIIIKPIVCM